MTNFTHTVEELAFLDNYVRESLRIEDGPAHTWCREHGIIPTVMIPWEKLWWEIREGFSKWGPAEPPLSEFVVPWATPEEFWARHEQVEEFWARHEQVKAAYPRGSSPEADER